MSQDKFQEWFRASFEALIRDVFRNLQISRGGSYEQAQSALESALQEILRRWSWYRSRIYNDRSGNPMMATADGNPGESLFSFVVKAACKAAARDGSRPSIPPFDRDDKSIGDDQGSSPGSIARERADAFRNCWDRLEIALRTAIQQRWCHKSANDQTPLSQRVVMQCYQAYNLIRRCLVHRGWEPLETIDVHFKMFSIICDSSMGPRSMVSG